MNNVERLMTGTDFRRRVVVLAAALVSGAGLFALTAPAALADQPTSTLNPHQDQLYSTRFFGDTTFCAKNTSSTTAGKMYVASWGGAGGGPTVGIPVGRTECHHGWYWGIPAKVINTGATALEITVTP